MECNYKPYNWNDVGTPTIGAVPISSEGKDGQMPTAMTCR